MVQNFALQILKFKITVVFNYYLSDLVSYENKQAGISIKMNDEFYAENYKFM